MKNITSRAGLIAASAAALMSGLWGLFVPYGYPWPTIAWGVLACGLVIWVSIGSSRPTPRMTDVIGDVEAELPKKSAGGSFSA